MAAVFLVSLVFCFVGSTSASDLSASYLLTDALLREVVAKMGEAANDYLNYPNDRHVAKEYEKKLNIPDDYDIISDTMTRDQEYLQHNPLWGHQYVAGGAGEGKQRLRPNGSIKNLQEVKSDTALPAYCDPPNPCPLGYTDVDGCLENFANTAAFSREYQSAQECMCDTEHMFDCPSGTRQDHINALAQSIHSEGLTDDDIDKIIKNLQIEGEHKSLVAKKHHQPEVHDTFLEQIRSAARKYSSNLSERNPYLKGEKLPIVAKKGSHIVM